MMQKAGVSMSCVLARLRERAGELPTTGGCGAPYVPIDEPLRDGVTYCDDAWHYVLGGVAARCPEIRRREVQERWARERRRLESEIRKIEQCSEFDFGGYDAGYCDGGPRALAVMKRFGVELSFNVLLVGTTGLGKTHLLLASHFGCLLRGVSSVYVRTPELRKLFRALDSYDAEVVEEAKRLLGPTLYAQAVHFDDAGHIEHDARARGQFAEGLKDLLDRSRGRWAVATNRSAEEAERHPDLSGVILSRLVYDAEVVHLQGGDFRATTARVE